jgi:hypothetical protein
MNHVQRAATVGASRERRCQRAKVLWDLLGSRGGAIILECGLVGVEVGTGFQFKPDGGINFRGLYIKGSESEEGIDECANCSAGFSSAVHA